MRRSILCGLALASTLSTCRALADEADTIGPWRQGDFAYSKTASDDRPNEKSRELKNRYYSSLVPEKIVEGEKGVLKFRVAPRSVGWSGILILDHSGKPVPNSAKIGQVTLTDMQGKPAPEPGWIQYDTHVMFSDASRVAWPKTRIIVRRGKEIVDEATLDFSGCKFSDSNVQMSEMLQPPTSAHGMVQSENGRFVREGKPLYLWGGHVNHVPGWRGSDSPKSVSDLFGEVYTDSGINFYRSIALEEILADPATGAIKPDKLDRYHYLIAKLGESGIYFYLSDLAIGTPWGMRRGDHSAANLRAHFWLDTKGRAAWKTFLQTIMTTPNPYNGKAIKDDPTVIGFELSNETGLNERRFDYNEVGNPEATRMWREAFDQFLVKKYGGRDALAKAWERNPLLANEDPAEGTILIPTNFRGARGGYGGTGQHNQVTTGRWYINGAKYGLPAKYNPRVLDAIEFNNTVAKKSYPFDFNNLKTPEETERLRVAFNDFLLKKYGNRHALDKAWQEDQLFPWETLPGQATVKSRSGPPKQVAVKGTIVIPSDYHGQETYVEDLESRLCDPRISDAMEFTYEAQRSWAADMVKFLRDDVGWKSGIGWNGDTFHICQPPNHMANMMSPLQVAIAAEYCDSDVGDQLTSRTKNLKRFNSYGRIHGRPMMSYEWSMWTNQGPYVYEYGLLLALLSRTDGFDAHAHHQMPAFKYPVSDPDYSLKVSYISPLANRPQRGVSYLSNWLLQRSKIAEHQPRLLVGTPYNDAFVGGPERKMCNWAFENWLMYQLGTDDYGFRDVYDGPTDRVVVHCGHGPYGDYRGAKHAILWSHSNSDRDGKDPEAKAKWFALHGIKFAPGQKYFVNDQFFATTEDMTEYNVVHAKAERARDMGFLVKLEEQYAREMGTGPKAQDPETRRHWFAAHYVNIAAGEKFTSEYAGAGAGPKDYYWRAEPDYQPTELDRQLYRALKRWGYKLPFSEDEIDLVWRNDDRSMEMDTRKEQFAADRDDFQMWFGRAGTGKHVSLSRLEATTDEKQYAVALLPWDTADFATAKTLAVWSLWNSQVTVKLPMPQEVRVYAVNWLGKRLYAVKPISADRNHVTIATVRDDDIFCWEIVR